MVSLVVFLAQIVVPVVAVFLLAFATRRIWPSAVVIAAAWIAFVSIVAAQRSETPWFLKALILGAYLLPVAAIAMLAAYAGLALRRRLGPRTSGLGPSP